MFSLQDRTGAQKRRGIQTWLKLSEPTAAKQLEPNTALFYAKFSGRVKGFSMSA
jgi:hypothetical protein